MLQDSDELLERLQTLSVTRSRLGESVTTKKTERDKEEKKAFRNSQKSSLAKSCHYCTVGRYVRRT